MKGFLEGLTATHDLTATLERANAAGHTQADIPEILMSGIEKIAI